ncbi:MAG: thiamine pyrophosphate-dependent dehydrogenase E1 component subunit alpha [Rhodobacterales bacterium]|nr:thiamine pyrophosphate-dependent dehydrogenase E1 component subunit alpha [Rhodobacterales bacterium]
MRNEPSLDTRAEMHRLMVTTRAIEIRLGEMFRDGQTRGPIHRCDGQEAVGVGATQALGDEDYVTTTHRGHHVYVGRGLEPRRIIAEIFGRATGYCGGRGGHMLVGDASRGMLGGNAIVGAGIPAATGMALSIKVRGDNRVAMTVFGDGAAQTGICHEAMNMAGLWKLPVVFLLENNRYGLTVPQSGQSATDHLVDRATGYGMPGTVVDGNDVGAVYAAAAEAIDRARKGEGPTLIEARTYRVEGFSTSDMGGYQDPDEVARWRARDPIALSAEGLRDALGDNLLARIEADARAAVDEAFKQALADPLPEFTLHAASAPYAGGPR